ncbi:MAG: hypothetical protein ACE5F5_09545 [Acidimicrobiia bacterium]
MAIDASEARTSEPEKAPTVPGWREQRDALEAELRRGAIIVAMTDASMEADGYACTVTVCTPDGHVIHFASQADLLDGICDCSTSELR